MADLVGITMGKYQLVERLGRGGMADVYKGYQPGLDRYVAVKVLHPHLSEEVDFITRFQREARSVANLHHPYIVQVFDFDVQDERYYMVMEYIEGGQTLKELLQNLNVEGRKLPPDQTLDIIAKIADALDYAHNQGMIHRDIKPSNILLRSLNQPVLGDFGIARIIGQTGLTGSGAMIGTPAYMSPEQGRGEQADERSDLYALGIVLYEMLTGIPPYDADTPYGIILKHINDPIVPPGALIRSLPPDIEKITLKSLAKSPIDRYQSAGEMRNALRKGMEGVINATPTGQTTPPKGTLPSESTRAVTTMEAPIMDDGITLAAPPPQRSTETTKQKPSSRWIWATVGITAILILGVIIAFVIPSIPPSNQISTLTQQPASSSEDNEAAEILLKQGLELMHEGNLKEALDSFDQVLQLNPDHPSALAGRGIVLIGLNKPEAAAIDITHAYHLAPDNARVNLAIGLLHTHAEGHYDRQAAMAEFTKAIEYCGSEAGLCAKAYQQRALIQAWDFDNLADAVMDMNKAIEIAPDQESIGDLYAIRADMRFAAGEHDAGFRDFEIAYEKSRQGEFLERAAVHAVRIENYEKAMVYHEQLLKDQAGHPHYMVGKAYIQWKTGDLDAAIGTAKKALELHPDLPEGHYLLGILYREQGQLEKAMAELDPLSQATNTSEGYGFPFLMPEFGHEILYDMAQTLYRMGDTNRAFDFCDRSLKNIDWPLPYILRGRILAERGELGPAREQYLMALDRVNDNEELAAHINNLLAELSN
ncbi:MAG: protein kinase [Anaerolineae bacterium]|nr:protein kinase [Anaerolineae bacterium]